MRYLVSEDRKALRAFSRNLKNRVFMFSPFFEPDIARPVLLTGNIALVIGGIVPSPSGRRIYLHPFFAFKEGHRMNTNKMKIYCPRVGFLRLQDVRPKA